MIPPGCHKREKDWTVFISAPREECKEEEEWEMIEESGENVSDHFHVPEGFYRVISMIWRREDRSVKRGAVIQAMAIASRVCTFQVLTNFLPILSKFLSDFCDTHDQSLASKLFMLLNDERVSNLVGSLNEKTKFPIYPHRTELLTLELKYEDQQFTLTFDTHPLRCPYASVSQLLSIFGVGVMHVFDSVLRSKNLLVLGHGVPSATLCSVVLSLPLIFQPLHFSHLLPNSDFSSMGSLSGKRGIVMGSSNPLLEEDARFDVVADISKKTVYRKSASNRKDFLRKKSFRDFDSLIYRWMPNKELERERHFANYTLCLLSLTEEPRAPLSPFFPVMEESVTQYKSFAELNHKRVIYLKNSLPFLKFTEASHRVPRVQDTSVDLLLSKLKLCLSDYIASEDKKRQEYNNKLIESVAISLVDQVSTPESLFELFFASNKYDVDVFSDIAPFLIDFHDLVIRLQQLKSKLEVFTQKYLRGEE